MKIEATVVILTKNEELHIARAVKSASGFADVVVIDSRSTDRTVEIAEAAGARIAQFDWDGRYPKKKEWALAESRFDWVIYLDADEYFTEELAEAVGRVIRDPSTAAFDVPLRYFWLGSELLHGHRVSKRIGMRKSLCHWPRPDDLDVENMWEVEGHYQPVIRDGASVRVNSALGHDDQDGLYDYFARHNRYSDWEASMLEKRDVESLASRSRLGRLAARIPGKPAVFFVYSYFLRGGFLDGRAGWDYACALSFYYWQINVKRRELQLRIAP